MLFHACVINHTVCGLRMCNTHDINAMVWSEWCSYWCVTFHLGAITNFTVAPQQPKDSLIHKWWTTYLNCQHPSQYIFNKNKSRQNSFYTISDWNINTVQKRKYFCVALHQMPLILHELQQWDKQILCSSCRHVDVLEYNYICSLCPIHNQKWSTDWNHRVIGSFRRCAVGFMK